MAAGPRRPAVKTAVRLRISLMEHTPTIWRRLLVPGEITLSKLHEVFQVATGWEDYHLHYFEIEDERYGVPDEDVEIEDLDEEGVVFADVIRAPTRFFYECDVGDSWRHEVVVESIELVPLILKFAICLDGQRACPPEDCGGTGGSEESSRPLRTPRTKSTTTSLAGSVSSSILSSSVWARSTRRFSACAEPDRLPPLPFGDGGLEPESSSTSMTRVGPPTQWELPTRPTATRRYPTRHTGLAVGTVPRCIAKSEASCGRAHSVGSTFFPGRGQLPLFR